MPWLRIWFPDRVWGEGVGGVPISIFCKAGMAWDELRYGFMLHIIVFALDE